MSERDSTLERTTSMSTNDDKGGRSACSHRHHNGGRPPDVVQRDQASYLPVYHICCHAIKCLKAYLYLNNIINKTHLQPSVLFHFGSKLITFAQTVFPHLFILDTCNDKTVYDILNYMYFSFY